MITMNEERTKKRWIEPLAPNLSDVERAESLKAALDRCLEAAVEAQGDAEGEAADELWFSNVIDLADEDLRLLRLYARDPSSQVRAVVVEHMAHYGPCTLDDLELWCQDPDELVRQSVLFLMTSDLRAAGELCSKDRHRCVNILVAAMEHYVDYAAANAMGELWEQDDEWLQLTWTAAESLLDLHNPGVTLMLTCCYYEHVIPNSRWGPDHPNLRRWVEGDDPDRKMALLKIANCWGLDEGHMRDIIEALVGDPDLRIAATAVGILDGSIAHNQLWFEDSSRAESETDEKENVDD